MLLTLHRILFMEASSKGRNATPLSSDLHHAKRRCEKDNPRSRAGGFWL